MPDIKTAMSKVLEKWDNHENAIRKPQEKTMAFSKTGNLTHDVFKFIQSGAWTSPEVVHILAKHGYNKTSVHSIITQMRKAGMVVVNDGYLATTQAEYTPLKNPYHKRKKKDAPVKLKKATRETIKDTIPATTGIAALKVATTQTKWDAETVIANMGIKEAFKLYEELKKYFK